VVWRGGEGNERCLQQSARAGAQKRCGPVVEVDLDFWRSRKLPLLDKG
jgi:hypothetical protein